jgi:hypothetical protein
VIAITSARILEFIGAAEFTAIYPGALSVGSQSTFLVPIEDARTAAKCPDGGDCNWADRRRARNFNNVADQSYAARRAIDQTVYDLRWRYPKSRPRWRTNAANRRWMTKHDRRRHR